MKYLRWCKKYNISPFDIKKSFQKTKYVVTFKRHLDFL
jgi:hypothetical protein